MAGELANDFGLLLWTVCISECHYAIVRVFNLPIFFSWQTGESSGVCGLTQQ